jgi:AcrR family transcriptional regulator
MSTTPRPVNLGGVDLGDHRHVCALVDGPADADDVLMPFIAEGIEAGDRAFHIVDPGVRDEHLGRLSQAGIDVPAALGSGQLEVWTWMDAYLKGGTFDPSAQLAYLRAALDDGVAKGYARTRLIGSTEWALDEPTVQDLLAYEARIDGMLGNTETSVLVCTYDLKHHSARTIADVIGVHQAALVGGALRSNRGGGQLPARERLVAAASRLFHGAGIQATGVDTIIAEAGVAKATFYRHFPSKADLVVAWLRDPRARWLDRVKAQVEARAAGRPPGAAIPLFFEALAEWLEAEGYRGCPYLNTSVEITDPAHPARAVVVDYLQEVEDHLAGVLAAAGYGDSRALAMDLQTLAAGSISLAVARRNNESALSARDAAVTLLRDAERD